MTFDRSKVAGDGSSFAQAFQLCSEVAVVIWDVPAQLPALGKFTLAMQSRPVPLVSMTLPRADGGQCVLWAMKPGSEAEDAQITAADGSRLQAVALQPAARLPLLDVESLLGNLSPEGRVKFLNNLLTVWRSVFRLSRDELFSSIVEDAVLTLVPAPRLAHSLCQIAPGRYLVETDISPVLGEISAIYAIGVNSILPLPSQFVVGNGSQRGWQSCHFILGSPQPARPLHIMFLGKKGIAVRSLPNCIPRYPGLQKWWAEQRGDQGLREFVVRQLSNLPGGSSAVAIDLQMRAPLPARQVARSQMHATVDIALSLQGGLLAGGWTKDPTFTLAGIDYLKEDGTALPLDGNWYEFPAWSRDAKTNAKTEVTGFVAWLPLDEPLGPLLQPRFQMRLASGAVKPLVPKPQPFEPVEQRNRILRAVPPQHAVDNAFRTILAPALQGVERELGKTIRVDHTKDYGQPQQAPLVSIVVPLYRVLDFLRFQLSGMATDPWLAENAEIIFVLDSPEIEDETKHMLGGLHILHGLPMKLVVMNRNGGYSRACNAGARFARGAVLVMLNSDVVPREPGWLQLLSRPLLEQRKLGAIGPKLIFEDGSLQHAGLYFGRDQRGIWLNHHFYKGMPGRYPPAQVARNVPGVTGACLVTRRETYERVDGYTEDYVIGDYEDSDLCLKIRRLGLQIAYEPAACLYHFERRSISRSQDYMRGVASQYNSWLHTQRWEDDIAALNSDGTNRTGISMEIDATERNDA
ncbi:GT2 family glycosyltransferase [Mesorhizobium soli]|uniref:glycosyltransferase family 2 protein n=1 Tax=Pseudaminobacter soli (ex Li et al. 2025) TaxID=1295366 RepID=UPI002474ACE3|nr:glycosyltransferase family 2 protein [Mesorhizobium soli]MDH6233093.1 GT2 family glycosyltransferase [Mesorhizobium soli]